MDYSFEATPNESLFRSGRLLWIGTLLVAGVLLVAFAPTLGVHLVRNPIGVNGFTWDPEEARAVTESCRWVGTMLFCGGLFLRLVVAIERKQLPPPAD